MKLLYIANIRIPTEKAYGIQIMEMCSALARARETMRTGTQTDARLTPPNPPQRSGGGQRGGSEVVVELVVPTRRNPSFQAVDPFEYYGVEKNFSIQYLNTHDPTWLMGLPGGLYIKIQSLLFMRSLRKYFRNEITNYKLQITNNNQNSKSQIPNKSQIQNPKFQTLYPKPSTLNPDYIIYTRDEYLLPFLLRYSDNVVWEGHTLPARRERYVKYWNRCRAIIVITKGLKDELVGLGVAGEKILVAPDGVDLNKFRNRESRIENRERLKLPTDKKIVLYTGQLFEWKGADVLLEAARVMVSLSNHYVNEALRPASLASIRLGSTSESRRVRRSGPEREQCGQAQSDILFVFVGGMKEDVEKFKQKAEGLENVLILGHQSHDKIPLYQMSADVLVMPNKTGSDTSERWTSPLKCFEYMASSVPIVASDLPSIREVLNESNSVLVEPNNPQALAEGVQKVLQNQELAGTIAQKANGDVREYSWEKRAEKILSFLTI